MMFSAWPTNEDRTMLSPVLLKCGCADDAESEMSSSTKGTTFSQPSRNDMPLRRNRMPMRRNRTPNMRKNMPVIPRLNNRQNDQFGGPFRPDPDEWVPPHFQESRDDAEQYYCGMQAEFDDSSRKSRLRSMSSLSRSLSPSRRSLSGPRAMAPASPMRDQHRLLSTHLEPTSSSSVRDKYRSLFSATATDPTVYLDEQTLSLEDANSYLKRKEQKEFERCEELYLPLLQRWKRAVGDENVQGIEGIMVFVLREVESFSASFIEKHGLPQLMKESRVLFEHAGADMETYHLLWKDMWYTYKTKAKSVPADFVPTKTKKNDNQLSSDISLNFPPERIVQLSPSMRSEKISLLTSSPSMRSEKGSVINAKSSFKSTKSTDFSVKSCKSAKSDITCSSTKTSKTTNTSRSSYTLKSSLRDPNQKKSSKGAKISWVGNYEQVEVATVSDNSNIGAGSNSQPVTFVVESDPDNRTRKFPGVVALSGSDSVKCNGKSKHFDRYTSILGQDSNSMSGGVASPSTSEQRAPSTRQHTEGPPHDKHNIFPISIDNVTQRSERHISPKIEFVSPRFEGNAAPRRDLESSPRSNVNVSPGNELGTKVNLSPQNEGNLSAQNEGNLSAQSGDSVSSQSESCVSEQSEDNLSPESDYNLSPGSNYNLSPGSNYHFSPGSNYNLSPGSNYHFSPGSNCNLSPGSDCKFSPGSHHNLSPRSEAGLSQRSNNNASTINEDNLNLSPQSNYDNSVRSETNLSPRSENTASHQSDSVDSPRSDVNGSSRSPGNFPPKSPGDLSTLGQEHISPRGIEYFSPTSQDHSSFHCHDYISPLTQGHISPVGQGDISPLSQGEDSLQKDNLSPVRRQSQKAVTRRMQEKHLPERRRSQNSMSPRRQENLSPARSKSRDKSPRRRPLSPPRKQSLSPRSQRSISPGKAKGSSSPIVQKVSTPRTPNSALRMQHTPSTPKVRKKNSKRNEGLASSKEQSVLPEQKRTTSPSRSEKSRRSRGGQTQSNAEHQMAYRETSSRSTTKKQDISPSNESEIIPDGSSIVKGQSIEPKFLPQQENECSSPPEKAMQSIENHNSSLQNELIESPSSDHSPPSDHTPKTMNGRQLQREQSKRGRGRSTSPIRGRSTSPVRVRSTSPVRCASTSPPTTPHAPAPHPTTPRNQNALLPHPITPPSQNALPPHPTTPRSQNALPHHPTTPRSPELHEVMQTGKIPAWCMDRMPNHIKQKGGIESNWQPHTSQNALREDEGEGDQNIKHEWRLSQSLESGSNNSAIARTSTTSNFNILSNLEQSDANYDHIRGSSQQREDIIPTWHNNIQQYNVLQGRPSEPNIHHMGSTPGWPSVSQSREDMLARSRGSSTGTIHGLNVGYSNYPHNMDSFDRDPPEDWQGPARIGRDSLRPMGQAGTGLSHTISLGQSNNIMSQLSAEQQQKFAAYINALRLIPPELRVIPPEIPPEHRQILMQMLSAAAVNTLQDVSTRSTGSILKQNQLVDPSQMSSSDDDPLLAHRNSSPERVRRSALAANLKYSQSRSTSKSIGTLQQNQSDFNGSIARKYFVSNRNSSPGRRKKSSKSSFRGKEDGYMTSSDPPPQRRRRGASPSKSVTSRTQKVEKTRKDSRQSYDGYSTSADNGYSTSADNDPLLAHRNKSPQRTRTSTSSSKQSYLPIQYTHNANVLPTIGNKEDWRNNHSANLSDSTRYGSGLKNSSSMGRKNLTTYRPRRGEGGSQASNSSASEYRNIPSWDSGDISSLGYESTSTHMRKFKLKAEENKSTLN